MLLDEVYQAQKEVLIGKKSMNCLSCGIKESTQQQVVTGRDGRVYRGENLDVQGYMESKFSSTM